MNGIDSIADVLHACVNKDIRVVIEGGDFENSLRVRVQKNIGNDWYQRDKVFLESDIRRAREPDQMLGMSITNMAQSVLFDSLKEKK